MSSSLLNRADLSAARDWFAEACRLSRRHSETVARAEKRYGDHGPTISGIVRDHFPDRVKNALRSLARGATEASDNAWSARPKRVRSETMRRLSRAVAARDGSGFYGPQR